jgi:hypothetical protein
METFSENRGELPQLTPAEWFEEFNQRSLDVKRAAEEWAVRWNEPEGKFISALLCSTAMQGELVAIWDKRMAAFTAENREIVQAELNILHETLAGAKHVLLQGEVAIRQARQIQHNVEVEKENMVVRMIKETLPLFAEKLKGALVIREQGWNAKARDRRYAIAAAITTALLLFGYSLSWWQDSGKLDAFNRCLTHPVLAGGQYYCSIDATLLGLNYPPAPAQAQNSGG